MEVEQTQQQVITQESQVEQQVVQESQVVSSSENTHENTEGFTSVGRNKRGKHSVTPNLSYANFQKLFSGKVVTFYDKYGRDTEFENYGVMRRTSEEVKDKNGKLVTDEKGTVRTRHTVYMKTYVSLMGDIVMFTWDDGEVSFYTKLNHPDLPNWGRKMYWKTE